MKGEGKQRRRRENRGEDVKKEAEGEEVRDKEETERKCGEERTEEEEDGKGEYRRRETGGQEVKKEEEEKIIGYPNHNDEDDEVCIGQKYRTLPRRKTDRRTGRPSRSQTGMLTVRSVHALKSFACVCECVCA